MIQRFYVHNFRCLENFELPIAGKSSSLLIGKNGTGKSTIGFVLEILQRIARGTNRVGQLVKPSDFSQDRSNVPMRIEIEVKLSDALFRYELAFELPTGFRELRIAEERLSFDGSDIYSRDRAKVSLAKSNRNHEASFPRSRWRFPRPPTAPASPWAWPHIRARATSSGSLFPWGKDSTRSSTPTASWRRT